MTDCNNINKNLDDLEAQEKQLLEEIAKEEAELELIQRKKDKSKRPKTKLKDFEGNDVGIAGQDWWDRVEEDNILLGSEEVKDLVKEGFEKKQKPIGAKGHMLNYRYDSKGAIFGGADIPPTEENVKGLLEILGLRRTATEKGVELKRPFTQQMASQAAISMARTLGGDARGFAEALRKKLKSIDTLPVDSYTAARLKREFSENYARALEEVADLIPIGGVTDDIKRKLAFKAQWAHYFEQIDSQVARKLGQALRGRRFNDLDGIPLIDADKDLSLLSWDDITGGSLMAQVYEAINAGDPQKLRKIAQAKRLDSLLNTDINQPNFFTELHILNQYRKDNMFSAIGSWLFRNPGSVLVGFKHGLQDIAEGAMRIGVRDELKAAGMAARSVYQMHDQAIKNGLDAFFDGKATMGMRNLKEINPEVLAENKAFVNATLDRSWELLMSPGYHLRTGGIGSAVTAWNLVNASVRHVVGGLIEKQFGNTAGYTTSFRALNSFDEYLRTQSFAWITQHEAAVRSFKEADELVKEGVLKKSQIDEYVIQRSDEMTEKALFDGQMTDDELIKLRREIGVPLGENLDNETLRLKMFNDLKGVPNLSDEFGKLGKERGDFVTFTNKRKDKFNLGVQIARQNPIVEWLFPVWNVLTNGVSWTLNADGFAAVTKEIALEIANSKLGKKVGFESVDPVMLRQARANAIVSGSITAAVAVAWQSGAFTDGGPFDKDEYDRWIKNPKNIPYSWNGPFNSKLSGRSIDFFDVMGLQADLMRAFHEGLIKEKDVGLYLRYLTVAYGRIINNKASAYSVSQILNLVQSQGENGDVAVQLAQQSNGILPYSGLAGNFARGFGDPSMKVEKRRFPTADEIAAIEKDPDFDYLRPVFNAVQQFNEQALKNYPIANQIFKAPRTMKDWKGQRIERPLGLPSDMTTPFQAVITPDDPLYKWEEKHGFGTKPYARGEVEGVTMTNDEEYMFREHAWSVKAEIPASIVLGEGAQTIMGDIDKYVQGRTLIEALRKLSTDVEYNARLALTGSASITTQRRKGVPLNERKEGIGGSETYKPYNAIVQYYHDLGLNHMLYNSPTFKERWDAMLDAEQQESINFVKELTTLGVGRQ
tara:strand:- start:52 stop:3369 length:3318 start_codon:yes stop_codon:yes gene_type:complete